MPKQVVFGRVNRRYKAQPTLEPHPFAEDMAALSNSKKTIVTLGGLGSNRPARTWIAADMRQDPSGDFMTGLLGFQMVDEVRQFDDHTWSWSKGETEQASGAFSDTVVPFAVDLREGNRWVAFVTSQRIQRSSFKTAFKAVVNNGVRELGLWPSDWDFDLLASPADVFVWLEAHPLVFKLERTIRFSNPGLDLDADRDEMRKLHAKRKTEIFAAERSQTLATETPEFRSKLVGLDTGDATITLKARGEGTEEVFRSSNHPVRATISDFGTDYDKGMALVLNALRGFVYSKPASPTEDET